MKINFISNISLDQKAGGWDGINYCLFNELSKLITAEYIGPINPPILYSEKIISKIFRVLGLSGKYYYFSDIRLDRIKADLDRIDFNCDYLLFFGATPWIKYKPKIRYAIYLDICFPGYIDLFLNGQKFTKKSIGHISNLEKYFLINADHIFWGSAWAKSETEKIYKIEFQKSTILSTGGYLKQPDSIIQISKMRLVFISLNFAKKGGLLAFEVYKKLQESIHDFELVIIGQEPPKYIKDYPGVHYIGYLNKSKISDMNSLVNILSNAFFLIHPTEMDTMGAVIAEAGYCGLPTIAPDNFGIPDLISNGNTGILVDLPLTIDKFVIPLLHFYRNPEEYKKMRVNVHSFMTRERTWEAIAKKIVSVL